MRINDLVILPNISGKEFERLYGLPSSLIPLNGQPVLYQTILNFIETMDKDGWIYIGSFREDTRLVEFIKTTFSSRYNIKIVNLEKNAIKSEIDALFNILVQIKLDNLQDAQLFLIKEGTFIDFKEIGQFEYLKTIVRGFIGEDKETLAWYHTSWKSLLASIQKVKNRETLDLKTFFDNLTSKSVSYKNIKNLINLNNYDFARKISPKLLGCRKFNSIQIDEKRALITKSSSKDLKILQEINYYLNLPNNLKIYFPRLFEYKLGKTVSYTIEYYPYKTLSQFFVMYKLPVDVWKFIFDKVFDIYEEFSSSKFGKPSVDSIKNVYLEKIYTRFSMLQSNREVFELTDYDQIVVNGTKYPGWKYYLEFITETINDISKKSECQIIHGDLCFSNILFEPSTGIIRFIDPRGEFYEEGIYGDFRYDIAKLLHSIHGKYDYIIHGMYTLNKINCKSYDFRTLESQLEYNIEKVFFNKLKQKYKSNEIREFLVLEALLFLTMLPLHSDDEARQKCFYLIAIKILDQAINYKV